MARENKLEMGIAGQLKSAKALILLNYRHHEEIAGIPLL
jgi:hypothetical protein